MRLPTALWLVRHYLTCWPWPWKRHVGGCLLCKAVVDEAAPKLWPAYIIAAWIMLEYALLHG